MSSGPSKRVCTSELVIGSAFGGDLGLVEWSFAAFACTACASLPVRLRERCPVGDLDGFQFAGLRLFQGGPEFFQ